MAIYRGDGGAGVANPTYETAVIADQTGNSGKYLTTNGSDTSWATVSGSFTYPGAGIALSTGSAWGTSITDNSSNWNTAFGWGNHASAGYLTSSTAASTYLTQTNAASTYQPLDSDLTAIAALSPTADNFIVGNGTAWILETPSAARTSLGLGTAATMTGPSGTIVGTTDTQTLSAKTLTSPIISSISNTGTLTLPTSTDTLVGRATTDTLTNKTLTNPTVTNYIETLHAPAAGTAFTVDLANGTVQKLTSNGNLTVTLPSSVSGKSFVIIIAYGGAHTLTWAGGSTIKWLSGTTPTATSVNAKFDIFTFFCDGTNTYGSIFGQNF